MKKIIVGYHSSGYNERRNFIDAQVPNCTYKKTFDLHKFHRHLHFKLKKKVHPFKDNLFKDFNSGSYDLLHFWNSVSEGKKPWITTFEYYLPRGAHYYGKFENESKYIDRVLELILGDPCKKLIATSDYALNAQKNYLKDYGKYYDQIINKVEIIHPSQKLLIDSLEDKPQSDKIRFALVGGVFFHKGGREVLEVFEELLVKGAPVELVIVSSLETGDFASKSTQADKDWAVKLISKYEAITWHKWLPNADVMKVLKETDIVLLPSFDETYGYSALEGQAAGCPVISTDGAALAEINNNEIGWLIEVDKDKDRRSVPRSDEARAKIRNDIKSQLMTIISSIIEDPERIKIKANASLKKIRTINDPVIIGERIRRIYDDALL